MSQKARDKALAAQELMAHVPDLVLKVAKNLKSLPVVQHLDGVLMFLDISGFTALCEEYNKKNLGVDALTKTLNDYLGHIEDSVLKLEGDVIEFAGDALLVVWEYSEDTAKEAMRKALKCARQIQKKCHDWKTDVGVLLGVKVALANGPISISFVGSIKSQLFSTSGQAVADANETEKQCEKGTVVISPDAWKICPDKKGIFAEKLEGDYIKVMALKKTWAEEELEKGRDTKKSKKTKSSVKLGKDVPVRNMSVKLARKVNMRPYIAIPVLRKVDENQPLEYLCEMREVSTLFINLLMESGYDHLQTLQAMYEKVHASVLQFQGLINKIFEFDKGTSFLVLFGLPGFKHEDEVSHALQCAAQIKSALDALMNVKQVSIGVTTGKVFCGVVGHPERHEYTVIGPKVNMAARLMMNYTGKVSCDMETKRRSKFDKSHFAELPAVTLKGVEDAGVLWEYQELAGSKTLCIPESKYPLLGYVKEFLECINIVEKKEFPAASQKEPAFKFIMVEGEPGVGKTRFLRAILDVAVRNSCRIICTQPGIGNMSTPYHTVCTILNEVLELGHHTRAQEKEKKLERRFRGNVLSKHLSLLNNLLGIQLTTENFVSGLSKSDRTRAMHSLLRKLVKETQDETQIGTIIAIDDAHYIDKDSWQYLKEFVCDTTLIAFNVGPKPKDFWPEEAMKIMQNVATKRIKLEGLDHGCMEPLLCQLLEVNSIPRELTNMLTAHLKGSLNPSWVKQCVLNLLHHNQLEITIKRQEPECIVASGVRLMELEIPDSLRGCMIAFIDRLPEIERTAIKIASILGSSFNDEILCHLMHHNAQDKVRKTIGELVSAGVFMFDDHGIRFQSLTLQETAYNLLVGKLRGKLHERYALYLEDTYLNIQRKKGKKSKTKKGRSMSKTSKLEFTDESILQSIYPQLVTHWRKAGNMVKTVDYLIHAAESAVALGNTMQAISFVYQAKGLDPNNDQTEHLNALVAQATATLFLIKPRRMDVKLTQHKWQNAARKAREAARKAREAARKAREAASKPKDSKLLLTTAYEHNDGRMEESESVTELAVKCACTIMRIRFITFILVTLYLIGLYYYFVHM